MTTRGPARYNKPKDDLVDQIRPTINRVTVIESSGGGLPAMWAGGTQTVFDRLQKAGTSTEWLVDFTTAAGDYSWREIADTTIVETVSSGDWTFDNATTTLTCNRTGRYAITVTGCASKDPSASGGGDMGFIHIAVGNSLGASIAEAQTVHGAFGLMASNGTDSVVGSAVLNVTSGQDVRFYMNWDRSNVTSTLPIDNDALRDITVTYFFINILPVA